MCLNGDQNFPSDPTSFSKEDFNALRKTSQKNSILSRVVNVKNAIYNGKNYGPTFDDDLIICGDNLCN